MIAFEWNSIASTFKTDFPNVFYIYIYTLKRLAIYMYASKEAMRTHNVDVEKINGGWTDRGCLRGSVKMRKKEGFSPPPAPGQLLFSGRRGQRFRGEDLSGGGTHAVPRARREIEMVSREATKDEAEFEWKLLRSSREGSRDRRKKKNEPAAAFYRLNVVAR